LAGQQQGQPTPRSPDRTMRHCSDGRAQVMPCGSTTTAPHTVGVVSASAASSVTSSLSKRQRPASPGSNAVPGGWLPPAVASRGHAAATGSGDSGSSAAAAPSSSYVPPPRGSGTGTLQVANNQTQGASSSAAASVEGGPRLVDSQHSPLHTAGRTKSRRRVSMLVRETASAFGTALAAVTIQGQRAVVSGTASSRDDVYCPQECSDWCHRGTGNAAMGFVGGSLAASVSSDPKGR